MSKNILIPNTTVPRCVSQRHGVSKFTQNMMKTVSVGSFSGKSKKLVFLNLQYCVNCALKLGFVVDSSVVLIFDLI